MKIILLLSGLLLSINLLAQQSNHGLRLFIYEVTKTGKQLIPNGKMELTINDSTQTITTDDYGKFNITEIPVGECNIKIQRKDCDAFEIKAVEIMENKIVYLSFELICQSYINSLSKKERKQLGLLN